MSNRRLAGWIARRVMQNVKASQVQWRIRSKGEDGETDDFRIRLPEDAAAKDIKRAADKNLGLGPEEADEFDIARARETRKGWNILLRGYRGYRVTMLAERV